MDGTAADPQLGPCTLRMNDAAAGGHQIDLARPDRDCGAKAIAVHDLAVEQIGDGCKPNMRMRPHIETFAGAEFGGSEMIEEDERPDHARACGGQRAAYREAVAEIDRARHYDVGDGVARVGVACLRILAGEETHGFSPCCDEQPPFRPRAIV